MQQEITTRMAAKINKNEKINYSAFKTFPQYTVHITAVSNCLANAMRKCVHFQITMPKTKIHKQHHTDIKVKKYKING